jgi:hypothetical protein
MTEFIDSIQLASRSPSSKTHLFWVFYIFLMMLVINGEVSLRVGLKLTSNLKKKLLKISNLFSIDMSQVLLNILELNVNSKSQ